MLSICQCAVAKGNKVSPLFQSNEPLSMTISAPFRTLNWYRGEDRPYQPATLTMTDKDGKEIRLDLEVRVRGNFRSQRSVCANTPLKLNFKRKSLSNTVFDGENKLKLVTQCRNSDNYEQYLLLEYIIYRVYQLFTDSSLRVRLVTIHYYDSEKEKDLGTRKAFFLEDIGRMAKRLDLKEVHEKKLSPDDYDPAMINLVYLFEYFIGNTDWSSIEGEGDEDCCHNIIPLTRKHGNLVPVPYDFDISGLVNPPYAVVNESLPIHTVKMRLYRGFCQSDAVLRKTIAAFIDKRDAIIALYKNQPGLSERSISKSLDFINDFYRTIQDEKKLDRYVTGVCR